MIDSKLTKIIVGTLDVQFFNALLYLDRKIPKAEVPIIIKATIKNTIDINI